ncbi:MAG TPA: branched-chain amino acid ABC transporter substrate-binding protein [Candidatus Acidoferrales bacterium]|nr:branched-chain amino acid ABC transporter substrate-binding protein [Candidatus Acidoferrales bacterium]
MQTRRIGALAVTTLLVAAACSSSATTAPAASAAAGGGNGQIVNIGVELPMSGGEAPNGVPTLNGVKLAVADINAAGGINGYKFGVNSQDDAVNGVNNPQQGAKNITTLVNDTSVVAVVGPFNSAVAKAEIPISNAAGLLQCSPANTNPGLTQEWGGISPTTYRSTHPNQIAYVRVATTDINQGLAGATIAYQDVGARRAYVVDDTTTYGAGLAGIFVTDFEKMGGTVVKHDGAGASVTDYTGLLTAAKALNPDVVYYGGVTTGGGGLLRKQMVAAGMANIPFIGGDGISDGSAATPSSFLNLSGAQGDPGTWSTVAASHDIPNAGAFAAKYDAAYGTKAPGAYSAAAYACTQIILDAFKNVGKPDRAGVRAYITSGATFTTVLGTLHFDANGDTSQKVISEYKFDPNAPGGPGWLFVKQVDFGQTAGGAPS